MCPFPDEAFDNLKKNQKGRRLDVLPEQGTYTSVIGSFQTPGFAGGLPSCQFVCTEQGSLILTKNSVTIKGTL